mmetsp:Transcript_14071/g.21591  ORF Transcript_14071/g.21591 Transcript_14071/m.21591 type:complete len:426 (+) Transcript_14071:613-1890(+)|eukprot:CAMPEP_0196810138 /NCGR_PEP_ID=MMETSP1362-20130617/9967_1 /TAXON_ID=163516 /ORGANISM="Leptocylindrus danicus, Strain CCMP1856" /LENGTH=425 /DNA_ID=CAMNT_0042185025 /DNA_START=595 /DNA_END=1872 /DNA_ORIENTATION=+
MTPSAIKYILILLTISSSCSEAAFSPSANGISNRQIVTPVKETGHKMKAKIPNDRSRLTELRVSLDDIRFALPDLGSALPDENGLSSAFAGGGKDLIGSSVSHLRDISSLNSNMNGAMLDMHDTHVQSVILSDLAHFSLDFFGFLDLDVPMLRTAAVFGRLFSIGADYVPDHTINADEAIFQAIMLGVSVALFVRSTLPMTMAAVSLILSADKSRWSAWKNTYAFYHLFSPAGVSMLQFRCLTALGAVDWINVDPHVTLVDELDGNEYLYWVYRGSTELVLNDGTTVNYVESSRDEAGNKVEFSGFLADMDFLCTLELNKVNTKKGKVDEDEPGIPTSCIHPQVPIKAGPEGARVMRLEKKRLIELMKYDDDLSEPVQALLVKGMQQMLSVLLNVKRKSQAKSPGASVDDSILLVDPDECIIIDV